MIGYNSMEPPDTQPTTVCRECGGDFSVAEDDPNFNLDGEYTCEDCRPDPEGHYMGCICADCSNAELTADNN